MSKNCAPHEATRDIPELAPYLSAKQLRAQRAKAPGEVKAGAQEGHKEMSGI